MRLAPLVVVRTVACALLATLLGAAAVPAAGSPPAEPKPGKKLCSISEDALAEISGLVATKEGYVAVADGAADGGQLLQVFDLDDKCGVTERHTFQEDPFDPEDMAITGDGTLWIADTGDNNQERETVALWKIAPDRSSAVIHRLTYPDGKHDAEALLMPRDGKPVIITKDLDGTGISGIYVPKDPLKPDQSVPLTKVGELKLPSTGTGGNRFGAVGQKLVTGAAMSTDGKRAVVRTYADAYEWRVSGGDVVKALTKSKPVRTPLPGEAQGEAITFSRDGDRYVTATEAVSPGDAPRLFSYTPAKPPAPKKPAPKAGSLSWFDNLSLQDIKIIIAVVGVIGVILLLLGIWGIRRHRRRFPPEYDDDRYDGPDDLGGPGGRNGVPGRGGAPYPDRRDPRDPRAAGGPGGARAAGRATVGPPPGAVGVGRARPPRGSAPAPRDVPPPPIGRGPAPGTGRVPPAGSARVPPPTGSGGGTPPRSVRARPDDPHFGRQPPSGEYW